MFLTRFLQLTPGSVQAGPVARKRQENLKKTSSQSMQERRPQVEGQRKFNCAFFRRRIDPAGGMAVILESGQPAGLRLVGIDRLGIVAAAAGMGDVIGTTAERAAVPGVDQREWQRRADRE